MAPCVGLRHRLPMGLFARRTLRLANRPNKTPVTFTTSLSYILLKYIGIRLHSEVLNVK